MFLFLLFLLINATTNIIHSNDIKEQPPLWIRVVISEETRKQWEAHKEKAIDQIQKSTSYQGLRFVESRATLDIELSTSNIRVSDNRTTNLALLCVLGGMGVLLNNKQKNKNNDIAGIIIIGTSAIIACHATLHKIAAETLLTQDQTEIRDVTNEQLEKIKSRATQNTHPQ